MYTCMGYFMNSCFFFINPFISLVLTCKTFYQMFISFYLRIFVLNVNLYELYYLELFSAILCF